MPIRRALDAVAPYRPQPPMEALRRELGLERIVKLASNEGAFGPLPAAASAYRELAGELHRYPDGGAVPLRAELARRHGVAPGQVVLGNGADELIRLCAVAVLDPGDGAVHPWPSFPSYAVSAATCGAEAVAVALRDRALDLAAIADAVAGDSRRRLVYLANPNNPTGTLLDPEVLRGFLDALPAHVLCVLDEAYADFADPEPEGPALLREGRENVCVLRTFSKLHGLAGLRVGYALAPPRVADALDRVRPIFNVNAAAQAAALASLGEETALAERVAHVRRARGELRTALADAGLDPVASQANFVFAGVPGGDGEALAARLLRAGFIVRALAGFGAPEAIRVTCGTDAENAEFAAALRALA